MRTRGNASRQAVLRLLSDPLRTFASVGAELGVTGERVRQIALEAGIRGRDRRRARAALKPKPNGIARSYPLIWRALQTQGIVPDRLRKRFYWKGLSFVCRRASARRIRPGLTHLSFSEQALRHDFVLYEFDRGVFVFPWRNRPKGTMISLEPRSIQNPYDRHDYRDYLGAWHLVHKAASDANPRGGTQ